MPPLNSDCHAGAREVFAALSTCPKSLRPVWEIQVEILTGKKGKGAYGKLDLDLIRKMAFASPQGAFVLPYT